MCKRFVAPASGGQSLSSRARETRALQNTNMLDPHKSRMHPLFDEGLQNVVTSDAMDLVREGVANWNGKRVRVKKPDFGLRGKALASDLVLENRE